MRSTVRPAGRARRLLGVALLVALPLAGTTACSGDEPVEDGVVEEEDGEEEEDD